VWERERGRERERERERERRKIELAALLGSQQREIRCERESAREMYTVYHC